MPVCPATLVPAASNAAAGNAVKANLPSPIQETNTSPNISSINGNDHGNGDQDTSSEEEDAALKAAVEIVDIRASSSFSNTDGDILNAIAKGITTHSIPFKDPREIRKGKALSTPTILLRSLPTMILYDDKGLEIFDKITYDKDYYLTDAEIDILRTHSRDLVKDYVVDGSVLIELGAGAMRKTRWVLEAIAESGKKVTYCAVDLAKDSLTQSLAPLVADFPSIHFIGLWGTYHDSLDWTSKNVAATSRKMFLWLGSSMGNLTRKEAAEFMTTFQEKGMNVGDIFLCGIDRRNDFETVSLAYNDRSGLSRAFSMNGFTHMNALFKSNVFNIQNFEFVSIYNEVDGRHEAYFESLVDQTIQYSAGPNFEVNLKKGELISFEYSYKYSEKEIDSLVQASNLINSGKWTDKKGLYDLHLLSKSPAYLSGSSSVQVKSPSAAPSLKEWEGLWQASDLITTKIIEPSRYCRKPIDLRHPYVFYLGHLPAFLDIQLSKATGTTLTEPSYFATIFERGIDPILEDPSQCHPHSVVPDQWPESKEIMAYVEAVREKTRKLLLSPAHSKRIDRVLFMSYEHEAMHMETLLYMFMQDEPNTNLSSILPISIFPAVKDAVTPASWIQMEGGKIQLGLDDLESSDSSQSTSASTVFGWDNEKPLVQRTVEKFSIQHRPVTVGEYRQFLEEISWRKELIPASWVLDSSSSEWKVRSLYGPISFSIASSWPASCSHFQALSYAEHYELTLPTEEQLVYARSTVPESLSSNHSFSSFHPRPVEISGNSYTNPVGDGWELTNTLFNPLNANFEISQLYPGYSSDFFDGKHYVVLGGSWATLGRIAGRISFRNWYQSKYPYVFSKFRCVRRQ